MRQRIWRRLFAAALGVLALAGSAAAQNPVPPTAPTVVAQPAPGPTAPTVSSINVAGPGSGPVVLPGSTVPAYPVPAATRGYVMASTNGGYASTNCSTGRNCNNGCGSCKSDLGFAFGSCRSFFDPCGPRPHGGGFFGKCHGSPFGGTGPSGPFNPCVYDTYLNH